MAHTELCTLPISYISVEPDPQPLFSQFLSQLPQLLTLVGLFGMSAIVSAAESAYMSLSKIEIDEFRQSDDRRAQLVWKLISEPQPLLATILIVNNFVNVMAILISGSLHFSTGGAPMPDWDILGLKISVAALLQAFIVVTVLLFVGEIIPKVYATKNRLAVAPAISPLIFLLNKLLKPVSFLLIGMSRVIDRNIAVVQDNPSLQELRHAIDLTTSQPHNNQHSANEKQLLKGIVNFSQISVRSVMQSRVDVIALEIGSSFDEVIAIINEHGFSRMPVYEESLDKIVGILHIKDLLPMLNEPQAEIPWENVLREPYFVPESKKLDSLLDELKKKHLHIAVVVDEFGGTAGIVTLEDVLEEILGDISDEFDSDSLTFTKKSDNEYIFEGKAPLNDLRRVLHLQDDTFDDARGDNDTLGGLLLELHGRIPKRGDSISYKNYTFHIEAASENRIHQVRMVIN